MLVNKMVLHPDKGYPLASYHQDSLDFNSTHTRSRYTKVTRAIPVMAADSTVVR